MWFGIRLPALEIDPYAKFQQTGDLRVGFHHEVHGGQDFTVVDLTVSMSGAQQLHPQYGPVGQIELVGHFDLTASDFIL